MAAKVIRRSNLKVGKYYKVVNKRLKEWFYMRWEQERDGEDYANIFSGKVKNHDAIEGITNFPIEVDYKIKEITAEEIFLEVI
jgi:hypothetical protein